MAGSDFFMVAFMALICCDGPNCLSFFGHDLIVYHGFSQRGMITSGTFGQDKLFAGTLLFSVMPD